MLNPDVVNEMMVELDKTPVVGGEIYFVVAQFACESKYGSIIVRLLDGGSDAPPAIRYHVEVDTEGSQTRLACGNMAADPLTALKLVDWSQLDEDQSAPPPTVARGVFEEDA